MNLKHCVKLSRERRHTLEGFRISDYDTVVDYLVDIKWTQYNTYLDAKLTGLRMKKC